MFENVIQNIFIYLYKGIKNTQAQFYFYAFEVRILMKFIKTTN